MRDGHTDDTLSVVSRVVTAEAQQQRLGIPEPAPPDLSQAKQYTITCLILICNFIQFLSMFSTVAGGFAFNAKLGHEAKPGQANWMAAAYSLPQSAFVLITGRLGAIYGHQRLLLLGSFTITIFSLCNAFCNTYVSFVAARALTGIGGGIIMPNAVATLTIMVPPGKARNITLAIFTATPPVGALVGALLVGAFLQYAEWKWHFILIACLGVPVLAGLFFVLPHEEPVDKGGKADLIGAFLGLSGLLLFNIAWNQAPSGGWQTPYIIVILILSSRFADEPIMPLAVFIAPSFNALIFVVLFIYMSVGISLWYMVAWQQLIRGWTVLHVAIGWIPYGIGASIAVTLAAWLITVLEAQYILSLGCLTSIVACVLLATMPEQQIYWAQVFPATVIGSLCPDFVYVAAQIIASNSVGKREQGIASSLIGTLNLYGNSLGLGFDGTIEVQIANSTNSEATGIRAGLWFGAALGITAPLIDLEFVRMNKNDRCNSNEQCHCH
ncbi:MFS general substrate transporter [Aspergillus sclerotioniger CBS 115572]|uniref:MFS general substrate transporter n=1 Tax=Aspergillus sclerotioniger CBS 115572 TaxID=1450535 RepID=A0A317X9V1_9EURO|nr:MFS general substrate transporter [Aspergillus sclerotioniger CBS 115572]PWY95324.1 MFS general substrate transporter [Aspergillus sclerotioniger CBS 115572]